MNEKLYCEHVDALLSINNNFTVADCDNMLARLLAFMPNGGKLYKYRSIEGDAFANAYDALENGYLWIPKANQLNDDEEAIVYYDPLKTASEIVDYIIAHPYEFVITLLDSPERKFAMAKTKREEQIIRKACACLDGKTGMINRNRALAEMVKDGIPFDSACEQLDRVIRFVEDWPATNIQKVEDLANKHLHYNDNLRELAHIFSMSARYDIDTMWAYYGNNNAGFCVEYDFSKVQSLPIELKRQLISVFKVIYSDTPDEFSFRPLLEWYLGGKNPTLLNQETKFILGCLLTKKAAWQHEQEWRIFLTGIPNRLNADIVSGIIIDERVQESANGKKLIALATERGWEIKVRQLTVTRTQHIYTVYNPGKKTIWA